VFGPFLGGWLTEEYGWPWIFFINIPFSVVGITLTAIYMEDPPYLKRGIQRVDWGGIILLLVGLVSLQIFLERGQEENWFESAWITAMAVVTVASLAFLVYWELRVSEPIINFRVLRNIPLAVGSLIILVFGMAQFGTVFILPQFLQELLGYTPYNAGAVLLPRGLAIFVVLPVVGWLFNYISPRILVPTGVFLIIMALFQFSTLSLEAGMSNLIPPLMLMGAGAPFVFVTLSATALRSVESVDATAASSFFNLARRMGGNIGFAVLTTILERRFAYHRISLISYVNEMSGTYHQYKEGLMSLLFRRQVDVYTAKVKSIALIDKMINAQATMLAYNDAYSFLIICFAAILPLVLLIPGRKKVS
ncbi:MAG: DHA2 family efflux MFS transporter permease subunit, partial [bacterium]|nr:DHA2 family efflux MFS transporter permease subunit [bacterium]